MESETLDIQESAQQMSQELLSAKSRQHNISYNKFLDWCNVKKVAGKFAEDIVLAYFEEKAPIWKSSTLWAHVSIIKSSLHMKRNTDIEKYYKVFAFLKRKSEKYKPKNQAS